MCSQNKKEKLKELLDYVRGDYNVFYALDISRKENYHSRMIADLLNPNGHHQLGNMPLKKFCEIVEIAPLQTEKLYIKTEKYTDTNRRMDIYIKENNVSGRVVIIENKIGAKDQKFQLQDYHEDEVKKKTPKEKIHLFYLTLGRSLPSDVSIGRLNPKDFKLLSYKDHILPWLESILASSQVYLNNSLLSSTLLQYKNTVEYLANPEELIEKMAATIDKECNRDVIIKHLYYKLFDMIGDNLQDDDKDDDKDDDNIKCNVNREDEYIDIIIDTKNLTFRLYSTVLWLMRGERINLNEIKVLNESSLMEYLTSIFEKTPIYEEGCEYDHITWKVIDILSNNTLINISALEELTPNDIKFLLSDEEVYSPNFEQIINTLTKYIDIVKKSQAEQS